jgi:hypothetical protein
MKTIKKGSVYFIKHKGLSAVKVGYSENQNPRERIEASKTYSPYGVEVLGIIIKENARRIEQKIHKKYSNKRLNGEWFDITLEDVNNEIMIYQEVDIFSKVNEYFSEKILINNASKYKVLKNTNILLDDEYDNYLNHLTEYDYFKFDYKKEFNNYLRKYKINNLKLREYNDFIVNYYKSKGYDKYSVCKNGKRFYEFKINTFNYA